MSTTKSPLDVYVTHQPPDTSRHDPPLEVFVTYKPGIRVSLNADTDRNAAGWVKQNADTARKIVRTIGMTYVHSDTVRRAQNHIFLNADTRRRLVYRLENQADTEMFVKSRQRADSDTVRRLPYSAKGLNPSEISVSLVRGTLSDTFQMVTPYDLPLESVIEGKLLDFPYRFLVYETGGTGLMRTITGMYDVDKLLYTPFNYQLHTANATAKDHAEKIASILKKKLVIAIDDFTPESTYEGIGATIQNLAGSLFGWMGNLPQRWINVFLRNDTLCIIQRGHEARTIDITDTKHSRPDIDRKLVRSVWSGKGSHTARGGSITIEPLGFTGTISFSGSSCRYRYGLLVYESNNGETVSYDYDFDDYLRKKVTHTKEGETITVTYDYSISAAGEKFLAKETEISAKPKKGSSASDEGTIAWTKRETRHSYIGNGWYGTRVYVDDVYQGSSVGNGKPGGRANRYVMNQSNLGLGGKYPSGASSEGAALFDTEFPVKGDAFLKQLTKDIEWLNRKTEERISMDIWQYPHLIDFTDRIRYEGHDYYLESNRVIRTPTELKQTIEIVRWY